MDNPPVSKKRIIVGLSLEEKFFMFASIKDNREECWEWKYTVSPQGYGVLAAEGKSTLAHRYSYEYFRNPIPKGYLIDHIVCDNRICCNPWHLKLCETDWENVKRSESPSSKNARKSQCPRCDSEYVTRIFHRTGRIARRCPNCDPRTGLPKQDPRSNPGVKTRSTHCPHGHEYTKENSLFHRNGKVFSTRCRECEHIRAVKKWAKRKHLTGN